MTSADDAARHQARVERARGIVGHRATVRLHHDRHGLTPPEADDE